MVSALNRKLLRDLGAIKGQVFSIALVVACGVACWIAARGVWDAFLGSRDAYYAQARFADVFATLERAPESFARRLEEVPGVQSLSTRVVERATVLLESLPEPAQGVLVSIPAHGDPPINGLYLRRGRMPDAERSDEILLGEAFADANGVGLGDRLQVLIGGVQHGLRVVGIALSPEFVFAMGQGQLAFDNRRFSVMWMPRPALASAVRMEGAFNDVVARLQPHANQDAVIAEIDRLLLPYGRFVVHGRDRQLSAKLLEGELSQIRSYALVAPLIFLAVAAFLLNVVLARLIDLQRTQIAVLKALGYGPGAIGLHFLGVIAVIIAVGTVIGVPVGAWVGDKWTGLYTQYFRLPALTFHLDAGEVATSVLVSIAAAALGAARTLWGVMRLPPATAMMPPAPPVYRRGGLSGAFGLARFVGASARMVLRETFRRPVRAGLSALGIGAAMGVLVFGLFTSDMLSQYMDDQFFVAYREDTSVALRRPVDAADLRYLAALPGVRHVEGMRVVPVRLRSATAGHVSRDVSLMAYPEGGRLRRVVEWPSRVATVQEGGVTLTRVLGERLGVEPGGRLHIEVLEGDHKHIEVPVRALVDEPNGIFAHATLADAARWLGEAPSVNMALLSTDPLHDAPLQRALREMPAVAGIGKTSWVLEMFRKQSAETMLVFTTILTLFGVAIAVAVVYNNARIALSTRTRDLATLRVLGFTRREVSAMLLGELGVHLVVGIPLGAWIGRAFVVGMTRTIDAEQFRMVPYISSHAYAVAVAILVAAALASALVVRRKLDRLDLVAVLKSKE
jgi:putative ABC transport system permease protein